MLQIIAAAALSLPAPDFDDAVFVRRHFERDSEFREQPAAVKLELWVAPSGQIIGRKIERRIGSEAIAQRICDLMKQRRIGRPRGASDSPTFALVKTITIVGPDLQSNDRFIRELGGLNDPPDLELAADPAGQGRSGGTLLLAIDPAGRVAACQPLKKREDAEFTRYCEELGSRDFEPLQDKQGRAVSYVRTFNIKLSPPR